MNRKTIILLTLAALCAAPRIRAEDPTATENAQPAWRIALSPMAGVDRNDLRRPAGPAGTVTMRDTGPMYGLFGIGIHKNWVFSNFLFFADVNDTDVWGNLFFANYYSAPRSGVAWNFGAGHLYHGINTAHGDITVQVPMVKTGPFFRLPSLNLTMNPYIGYGWERTDTPRGGASEDGTTLYGLTLNWRWRMLEAGVNYYYMDNRDTGEGYHVIRARVIGMLNPRWGLTGRVDYAEHSTTDDFSILAGPVLLF
ncbi:MAG: hypothetical protein U1E27_00290 [Kiritimatiellia bacterium]|nr:hypothetical protein [Kiritimatiellia bacterium]